MAAEEAAHPARARTAGSARRTASAIVFTEHHQSHAASAFFPSPFEEAAILTLDGVGEWATASIGAGKGSRIELLAGAALPALARPALLRVHLLLRLQGQLRRVQADGPRALRRAALRRPHPRAPDRPQATTARSAWNMEYFDYCAGLTMTGPRFDELFGGPPRRAESPITQREMDIAASIQVVTEEIVLRMARHVHALTGQTQPVPRRRRRAQLRRQRPAAARGPVRADLGPAGRGRRRRRARRRALRLAPAARPRARRRARATASAARCSARASPPPRSSASSTSAPCRTGAAPARPSCSIAPRELLAAGKVVGWFQGRWSSARARSERAASSATARSRDAGDHEPEDQVPRVVPAVRAVGAAPPRARVLRHPGRGGRALHAAGGAGARRASGSRWRRATGFVGFERRKLRALGDPRRHPRRRLGARADRGRGAQPALHPADRGVRAQTGCPVLVNTSFNVRGEPIVCTPGGRLPLLPRAPRWTRWCSRTSCCSRRSSRRARGPRWPATSGASISTELRGAACLRPCQTRSHDPHQPQPHPQPAPLVRRAGLPAVLGLDRVPGLPARRVAAGRDRDRRRSPS